MAYPYYQNYGNYNPMYYQQPQQHNQQIQNGGFVSAPSMDYARSYPVAPGNSVTFKIESQPYICTKTLGFSQLDQPVFEVFKLVKEDAVEPPIKAIEEPSVQFFTVEEAGALKTDIDTLKDELNELKAELTELKHELGGDVSKEVVSA